VFIYDIADGDTVQFPVEFTPEEVPRIRVIFVDGGITYDPSLTGPQTQVKEAVDITTTGFTAFLKLREADAASAATPRSLNFVNNVATKTLADDANDNRYRSNFSVTVDSGGGEPGIVNVVLQAKRSGESVFTTLAQRQYFGDGISPITFTGQTLVGTLLNAGANCEFRLVADILNFGGTVSGTTLTYLEEAALGEVSLTPGTERVSALIILSDD
jgi:hypothetical protein